MYVKRHEYFKWTPRTTWLTFVYTALIPGMFLYLGYRTDVCKHVRDGCGMNSFEVPDGAREAARIELLADRKLQGKYDLRGKRRGDTISEF